MTLYERVRYWMNRKPNFSDHGKFPPDALCEALGDAARDVWVADLQQELDEMVRRNPSDPAIADKDYHIGYLRGINPLNLSREQSLMPLGDEQIATILRLHMPDIADLVTTESARDTARMLPACESQVVVKLAIEEIKKRYGYDPKLPVCDVDEQGIPVAGKVNGTAAACNER